MALAADDRQKSFDDTDDRSGDPRRETQGPMHGAPSPGCQDGPEDDGLQGRFSRWPAAPSHTTGGSLKS